MSKRRATLYEDTCGQSDFDTLSVIEIANAKTSDSSSDSLCLQKSLCLDSTPEINLPARSQRRRSIKINIEKEELEIITSDNRSLDAINANLSCIESSLICNAHDFKSLVVNASRPITVNFLD